MRLSTTRNNIKSQKNFSKHTLEANLELFIAKTIIRFLNKDNNVVCT